MVVGDFAGNSIVCSSENGLDVALVLPTREAQIGIINDATCEAVMMSAWPHPVRLMEEWSKTTEIWRKVVI